MNNKNWLNYYRTNKKAIWIKVKLTNGEEFYYTNVNDWMSIKKMCDDENIFIQEFSLQFRSHEVKIDIEDAEALYLVRSVMGQMGGKTRQYYTTGILKEGVVYKKMWMTPELIVDKKVESKVSECFEEMLIYDTRKNREK